MNRDEILKLLKAAKEGETYKITLEGETFIGKVTYRYGKRGRGGFTKLEFTNESGRTKYWKILYWVPSEILGFEKVKQPRGRTTKATPVQSVIGNPDFDRVTKERDELKKQVESLRAQYVAMESLYRAAMSQRTSVGVAISADAMQFLRFSGIEKFPCSAEELKKGRAKMVAKLHPDHTQLDSNAQFCSAMRGFEELSKLCR